MKKHKHNLLACGIKKTMDAWPWYLCFLGFELIALLLGFDGVMGFKETMIVGNRNLVLVLICTCAVGFLTWRIYVLGKRIYKWAEKNC